MISTDRDAVVADKALLVTGCEPFLALPEQELFQIDLAGAALLVICKLDVWNLHHPFLDFPVGICYTGSSEGMQMQVVVLNGTLSEAEQDVYIKQVTARCPIGLIEKLFLNVQGKQVDVHYTRHRFRELRKMGGCCIGAPEDWNYAKQAELRDTVPNWVDP